MAEVGFFGDGFLDITIISHKLAAKGVTIICM